MIWKKHKQIKQPWVFCLKQLQALLLKEMAENHAIWFPKRISPSVRDHQDWHSPKWSHFVTQWSIRMATTVRYENSTTDVFLFLDHQNSKPQSPSRCFHRNFRNFPRTDPHKREQSNPETMACIGNSTPSSRHFAWRKPWPLMFRFFRARRDVLKIRKLIESSHDGSVYLGK